MLTIDEIKKFIEADATSTKKQMARKGVKYYEGQHDILNYRLMYVDADGNIREDKYKSNVKISHPFFTELVDQTVQYMLSGDGYFLKSDDPELQKELDLYFNENEDFLAEIYDCLVGQQTEGFAYMYAYKDADGKTAFQFADALGVVEIKAKEASDEQDHVIYWYIDKVNRDNKTVKRIQVWDAESVYYYRQIDNGTIELDADAEINPAPHILYHKDNDPAIYYDSFGFIPFFRLDNNKKQISALPAVKDLIDDYDLMACGLSNNIQDTNESLYVVRGFQGDNLDELMLNLRTKKHIGVDDDGGVDIKTVEIPVEARKTKLELDEKNIYRFGMGFNSAQIGDGNITNIVIKSRYALLDLKCNKIEIRLKQFLRNILRIVLDEINKENGTDYRQTDVYFDFKREVMTNAADNAQIELTDAQKRQTEINTLLNVRELFGDEQIIKMICEQLDISYEDIKDALPDKEEQSITDVYGTDEDEDENE